MVDILNDDDLRLLFRIEALFKAENGRLTTAISRLESLERSSENSANRTTEYGIDAGGRAAAYRISINVIKEIWGLQEMEQEKRGER